MRVLFCLMLSLAYVPLTAAEPLVVSEKQLDALIEQARLAFHVPGTAVVLVQNNKIVHLKGYGTVQHGKGGDVGPDTLFPLASCTKAFTTTAMAALVDDGRLNWEDPVRKHLPEFHLSDSAADQLVTLRDLLSHRTGLAAHDLLWYKTSSKLEDLIPRIEHIPLSAPFRSEFQYSSVPVIAAGFAAAKSTGETWEQLIRNKLITPLGLKSACFTSSAACKVKDRATGHRLGLAGVPDAMPEFEMCEPNPAGSLFLSARDLGTWIAFHLNDGQHNGKQLVSAKTLGETKQPHTIIRMDDGVKANNPETKFMHYGLGWVVYDHCGELVVAHGGLIDGFRVNIVLLPERHLGFAILNNLHQTRMNLALANTLIDALLKKPAQEWNAIFSKLDSGEQATKKAQQLQLSAARQPELKASLPLEQYAGTYTSAIYGEATVSHKDGSLQFDFNRFRLTLSHWQGEVFQITSTDFPDELLEFAVAKDGVTALAFHGLVFERVRK